jgi:hypothetical protein
MTAARSDLPTLTEVVELKTPTEGAYAPTAPMPIQDESVALEPDTTPQRDKPVRLRTLGEAASVAHDEELVAQVLVRLQPRLEAWVEAQVRHALMDLLPVWTESAALQIARDLRAEMPELLSLALDEVHRQRKG